MGGGCQVAKATYRDILERRHREKAVDFVEGLATALTPMALFETFMVKSQRAWRVFADRTGIGWTVTGHGFQQCAVRIT